MCIRTDVRCCNDSQYTMPPGRKPKNLKKEPSHAAKLTNKAKTTAAIVKKHALHIMKTLGKGHSERVYHRAMITSLNKAKVPHRSEVLSPIFFMGEVVGMGRCDLVIRDTAVEIKANALPPRSAIPQLRKYTQSLAKIENKKNFFGLIINFNQRTGRTDTLWTNG